METILITGVEGLVASHFTALYGHRYRLKFLSRRPISTNEYFWNPMKGGCDPRALDGVDHILHLAGAPLIGHRWTPRYRDEIITSRAGATALLGEMLMNSGIRLKTFVSASAVGYYGSSYSKDMKDETSPSGNDFLANVCKAWEEEAYLLHAENLAERVAIARFGIVLCHYAGALPRMAIGTKWGLAPIIGSGHQYVPWIHINDLCRILHFMIINPEMHGAYNAVAPDVVTYKKLISTVARIRSGSSKLVHIPNFILRQVLGEAADMMLGGSPISADRIIDEGFDFSHPYLYDALLNIYDL